MNNPRNLVLLPMVLAIAASAHAQSISLTGPETFDADGTILISGRIRWSKNRNNGYSTGKLALINFDDWTGQRFDYSLRVEQWFTPVFDKQMLYEGPVARIRFLPHINTSYPVRANIGIGFAINPYGYSYSGFYADDSHFARMDSNPNPPPVPEPATLIALSAGLVALVRKRRS